MSFKLLCGKEMADQLRIIKTFAYHLVVKGAIRGVRYERTIRVIPENLNEFIEGYQKTSETLDQIRKLIHPNDQIPEVDNGI